MCMMWPEFKLGSYGVRFMYYYLTLLTHFCLFTTLKMNSRCWTASLSNCLKTSDFLNWRKWHENIPPGPQKGLCLMYVEHLTGWGITLYCLSGHKNLNQRNKGNSPVTLAAENLHCHRPDACPCGANYLETKRRVPCETFAVHSFLSVQVPKTTASQRRQEPQSRFREVRGRPPGCCLNSPANIGSASWRSPHLPFLEKPWPALPSRESSFSGCLALTIFQTESLQGFSWLLCES